ncbi:hypothetical protein C9374_004026 [Naegleria lovaniensis]|uniref:EndoU domain-containing protein n=1 Tax=Naegleria lovaniensis TaxID=51637 RepID=A0AA88H962_NAELO|nr:uncharacterized protein C9374_004026 [Naegleria lovaniensis]KAG2394262.1 hypothetical protein C9374_004026 [Naegleria lovaniensis]
MSSSAPSSNNIFDKIWQADENRLTPFSSKPTSVSTPFITLVCSTQKKKQNPNFNLFRLYKFDSSKKQYVVSSVREFIDTAAHSESSYKTYGLIYKLFDNYNLDQLKREQNTPQEEGEISNFLDAIIETKCMKVLAQDYLKMTNKSEIKKKLYSIWFTQYDMGRNRDLSGFEHCVVGEKNASTVSGYHFWFKYLVDDSNDNFLGQDMINFAGRLDKETTADYVCIRFKQDEDVTNDHGENDQLFKSCGSFWVGISPECFMALCTVAHLEHLKGHKKALSNVVVNGHAYTVNVFSEGDYPRSVYPSLNE